MALPGQNAFTPQRVRVDMGAPHINTKLNTTGDQKELPNMETPHNVHYQHVKDSSADRLSELSGMKPPSTRQEVHDILCHMLEFGTVWATAETILLSAEWIQACHELQEHTNTK